MPAGLVKIRSRLTDEHWPWQGRTPGRGAPDGRDVHVAGETYVSAMKRPDRWRGGYTVFTGLCTSAWLSISPTTNTMMPTTTSFANACDIAR